MKMREITLYNLAWTYAKDNQKNKALKVGKTLLI